MNDTDAVWDRLPDDQDAGTLYHHGKDAPMANAHTLLRPIAESEGVVLKATHEHTSTKYFAVEDGKLLAASENGGSHRLLTSVDAAVAFAHTYGHDSVDVEPVPVEEAPEVLQA